MGELSWYLLELCYVETKKKNRGKEGIEIEVGMTGVSFLRGVVRGNCALGGALTAHVGAVCPRGEGYTVGR